MCVCVCVCVCVQKGEVVTVKRMSVGEGWWEGELNGRRGLFPSSFVKLVSSFGWNVYIHVPIRYSYYDDVCNCVMGHAKSEL